MRHHPSVIIAADGHSRPSLLRLLHVADTLARMFYRRTIPLILLGLTLAVLVGAGAYYYLHDGRTAQQAADRANFMKTCKQQGRLANGGGALAMDDATEEMLDTYCGCVADRLEQTLDEVEIGKIGDGSAAPETLAKLDRMVADCRQRSVKPAPEQTTPEN
jgi:hypothetical protein